MGGPDMAPHTPHTGLGAPAALLGNRMTGCLAGRVALITGGIVSPLQRLVEGP